MNKPRPESRISSLEKRATDIEANIVELAADTDENFRALRQDIKHLSDDVTASFKQSAEYQVEQEQKLEARLDKIDAIQSEHSKRFEGIEKRLDNVETLLQEILSRLPPK